ncbi:MAG: hypothetical protein ACREFD_07765 [Stellaceae bacterium]
MSHDFDVVTGPASVPSPVTTRLNALTPTERPAKPELPAPPAADKRTAEPGPRHEGSAK